MPKTKKRFIFLCLTIIATLTVASFSITASAKKDDEVTAITEEKEGYILKDFDGRLAIFENGEKGPILILDSYTNELPPKDQTRLYGGIEADSLEEIISIAENFE